MNTLCNITSKCLSSKQEYSNYKKRVHIFKDSQHVLWASSFNTHYC